MDDELLFSVLDDSDGGRDELPSGGDGTLSSDREVDRPPPRLRRVDRRQVRMMTCSLDDLLPADHRARIVWGVVEALDVSLFESAVAARGSEPGRAATDPRILIALWLYAALDGVGNGREIDRLCECHDAYRWLRGAVSMNYHTLNDFRVGHGESLDDLFTQLIALLVKQELVDVSRVAQDGVRIRASAGASSFRSSSTLERLHAEAHDHLEALKHQNDPSLSAQQHAKRLADAADRAARLDEVIRQLPVQQAAQQKAAKRSGLAQKRKTRLSTTDPDARIMKMPGGEFRPAYNVQLAADVNSRAIVGVSVTQAGSDARQDIPMREQIEKRSGRKVKEQLFDGGFTSLDAIDRAESQGVTIYAPVNPPRNVNNDRYRRKPKDTDSTFAWRTRMSTDEAKEIYKQRGATIETINGDLTEHRGLRQFPVRGSPKVNCVALWLALAYNILHFGSTLIDAANNPQ